MPSCSCVFILSPLQIKPRAVNRMLSDARANHATSYRACLQQHLRLINFPQALFSIQSCYITGLLGNIPPPSTILFNATVSMLLAGSWFAVLME